MRGICMQQTDKIFNREKSTQNHTVIFCIVEKIFLNK